MEARTNTELSVQQWIEVFLRFLCFHPNMESEDAFYFRHLFSERNRDDLNSSKVNDVCTLYYSVQNDVSITEMSSSFVESISANQWTSFQNCFALNCTRYIIDYPSILILSTLQSKQPFSPIRSLMLFYVFLLSDF